MPRVWDLGPWRGSSMLPQNQVYERPIWLITEPWGLLIDAHEDAEASRRLEPPVGHVFDSWGKLTGWVRCDHITSFRGWLNLRFPRYYLPTRPAQYDVLQSWHVCRGEWTPFLEGFHCADVPLPGSEVQRASRDSTRVRGFPANVASKQIFS